MKKKHILIIIFFFISFFVVKNIVIIQLNNQNQIFLNLKAKINPNFNEFIKKNFFKNYYLNKELSSKKNEIIELRNEIKELHSKNSGKLFYQNEINSSINNKFYLKKFYIPNPIEIYNNFNIKWNYIDKFNEKIILVLSSGKIFYFDKSNFSKINLDIKSLKSNLEKFVKINHQDSHADTVKDLLIADDKIYVSFVREVYPNCFTNSVVVSDMNLIDLKFKYFFNNNECVVDERTNNKEIEANQNYGQLNQSGGRLIKVKNEIIFTIGNYRSWPIAQKLNSIFGKILRINIQDGSYNILSMGHRNPQGLTFLDKENLIISSEHGPMGGDEINKIDITNVTKIQNFGYPIASYGNHYDGKIREIAPLNKSHKDFGFIEPIYFFNEGGIGPSEIISDENNILILSTLTAKKLIFFKFDDGLKNIENYDSIKIGERVRDIIKIDDDNFLMSLENVPSLGLLTKF